MRTLSLIALMIAATAASWAESRIMAQGAYMSIARAFTTEAGEVTAEDALSNIGLSVSGYTGDRSGVIWNVAFATITTTFSTGVEGASRTVTMWAADLGPGWRFPRDTMDVYVGAGAHVNGYRLSVLSERRTTTLLSTETAFQSWTLGPGAQLYAAFPIMDAADVVVGARAAYGLFIFGQEPKLDESIKVSSGLSWSLSVGLGFRYRTSGPAL